MSTTTSAPRLQLTALCSAVMAAFGAAAQDTTDINALSKPESEVSLGVGFVTNDNTRFGQYNGMVDEGAYGLLDFYLSRRNEQTGNWLEFSGRNVGLENRELRLEQRQQGDWGYFVDFSQTPRYSPYTVNTATQGIGTGSVAINAVGSSKNDVEFKTVRDALTLGLSKNLPAGWDVQVQFRNEEKNGERIFGRGTTGAAGHEFLPEPIDYSTQQVDATVGYTGKGLQLIGGYYGSWFNNNNPALYVTGGSTGGFTPIGLPPNNMAHQLYLTGGYSFTPTTRAMFKVAYARQTQNATFVTTPSAFVPNDNLDGRVDTTRVQLGVTSQVMPKLTVRADARYEDRDDKTPTFYYQTFNPTTPLNATNSPTATTDGKNEPRSVQTSAGKLEATYALPDGYRLTGGVDYENKRRNTSDVRSVSYRRDTYETGLRAELRRSLSETVNGTLGYVYSQRDGSPWETTKTLNGNAGSNLVAPVHLADRQRNKVRGVIDWSPLEALGLNFVAEYAVDDYSGRELGLKKGDAVLFSVDANYRITENWQTLAWYSRSDTNAQQQTCEAASGIGVCPNTAADPIWEAKLRMLTDAVGLGVRGKAMAALDVGADLTYAKDKSEFRQDPLASPTPVGTPLPDVTYTRTIFNLYGRYQFTKQAAVRLQYIFDRYNTDDYNWSAWTFTDGTTVKQETPQIVHFIGLSVSYAMW